MSGQTDLRAMLQSITVSVRPARYTVLTLPNDEQSPPMGHGVAAVIEEGEGLTVVATVERARTEGWPVDFVAAWLTIDVHSSLEAVGLTAAFSRALGRAGIACNVIAAYYHDHILVPHDESDMAVEVIEALASPTTDIS
jgi:hypothetical protein